MLMCRLVCDLQQHPARSLKPDGTREAKPLCTHAEGCHCSRGFLAQHMLLMLVTDMPNRGIRSRICPGNGGVHRKITLSIEGALSGHSYCPDACHGSQAALHAELLGAPANDHNPKHSHWGAHCEH